MNLIVATNFFRTTRKSSLKALQEGESIFIQHFVA